MEMAAFRDGYKENAEAQVKLSLAIEAIVKAEGIDATEDEINAEYENLAKMYAMDVDAVKKQNWVLCTAFPKLFINFLEEFSDFCVPRPVNVVCHLLEELQFCRKFCLCDNFSPRRAVGLVNFYVHFIAV